MKYYRVRREYDNSEVIKIDRWGRQYVAAVLIGQELFTRSEKDRLMHGAHGFRGYSGKWAGDYEILFDEVEIKKTDTFFIFGVRKEARR